jgi:hypothetical protein
LRELASLDQVSKLALTGCPRVDDSALAELVKWKSLKYLDVQETSVTEQGVDRLEKTKPGIVILRGPSPPNHLSAKSVSAKSPAALSPRMLLSVKTFCCASARQRSTRSARSGNAFGLGGPIGWRRDYSDCC